MNSFKKMAATLLALNILAASATSFGMENEKHKTTLSQTNFWQKAKRPALFAAKVLGLGFCGCATYQSGLGMIQGFSYPNTNEHFDELQKRFEPYAVQNEALRRWNHGSATSGELTRYFIFPYYPEQRINNAAFAEPLISGLGLTGLFAYGTYRLANSCWNDIKEAGLLKYFGTEKIPTSGSDLN